MGAIVLGILLGLGILNSPRAAAAIQQLEEAPGQMIYQSRQSLKDQHGNTWQAIAFKRIRSDGKTSFDLRLVCFPGVTEIDHSQPLTLVNSLGKKLAADDTSNNLFAETAKPEPNVGQYNLQPLLPQLQAEIPLKLSVSTIKREVIHLSIPPSLIQEWQAVFSYA
ncbi:DUF3122 domain-containing protein (plasmid) [Kovacikia minuta CCNUW1]|uniref:DUF3122 domain-containing protein n=1 Tax=Kovacikia minuta TaxID=2931930 RepID=UPI001CC9FAC3|nr:DUF3122 domain-containing protein [Kovacikia minuta]UBF30640.1 DUF3122 domain-containing protein [Kovacikia minuta CCNUW1]